MKNYIIKAGFLVVLATMVSCSDFDEINTNPTAASDKQVQVEYFLNNSITGAQQNPDIAERSFVLYWKAASRYDRTNSLPIGDYNDGWTNNYFNGLSAWMNHANTAIETAEKRVEEGDEKVYTKNLMQISRIWRVYLMSEMSDNFGPIPINAFQGKNPEFNSTKDVYYYMLSELKDAVSKIDDGIDKPENTDLDPAYKFDWDKWKKYGNSMRLRLAMRMSEVDETKAKEEFEDALTTNNFIMTLDDAFQVEEQGGWSDLTAVMSREWNAQYLSETLNNIYIGLGGIESETSLGSDYSSYIKDKDWAGIQYENHFTTKTNDPRAGFWFDGLHKVMDPRAYKAFAIPGDFDNPEFAAYPTYTNDAKTTKRNLVDDNGDPVKEIDAAYTWNASVPGDWGKKGSKNQLYDYSGTIPRMSLAFREGKKRIFFAPWETYFLIAEASVRHWNTSIDAKTAYEKGVKINFDYWELSGLAGSYLTSEEYNNDGTSVSWDHTTEPPQKHTMNYKNGYTGNMGTVDFLYPDNDLYKDGNVKNDHLTKIITQKFIAQFPYLPLEAWNDRRRLGLPFFPNPAVENSLPNLPALNSSNYMEVKKSFFPQRLKYSSDMRNSDPEGYQQAVDLLDGDDSVLTPLWWADN